MLRWFGWLFPRRSEDCLRHRNTLLALSKKRSVVQQVMCQHHLPKSLCNPSGPWEDPPLLAEGESTFLFLPVQTSRLKANCSLSSVENKKTEICLVSLATGFVAKALNSARCHALLQKPVIAEVVNVVTLAHGSEVENSKCPRRAQCQAFNLSQNGYGKKGNSAKKEMFEGS